MAGVVVSKHSRFQTPDSRLGHFWWLKTSGEFLPDVVNLGTNSVLRGEVDTFPLSVMQTSLFPFFLVEDYVSPRIPVWP